MLSRVVTVISLCKTHRRFRTFRGSTLPNVPLPEGADVDEERTEQEQEEREETVKDLDVSDEQAEDVKGGLGGRHSPLEKK